MAETLSATWGQIRGHPVMKGSRTSEDLCSFGALLDRTLTATSEEKAQREVMCILPAG